jgi:hypothetical protein
MVYRDPSGPVGAVFGGWQPPRQNRPKPPAPNAVFVQRRSSSQVIGLLSSWIDLRIYFARQEARRQDATSLTGVSGRARPRRASARWSGAGLFARRDALSTFRKLYPRTTTTRARPRPLNAMHKCTVSPTEAENSPIGAGGALACSAAAREDDSQVRTPDHNLIVDFPRAQS